MRRRDRELAQACRLAGLGTWEWDPTRDRTRWSDELFAIVGVEPGALEPSQEAFQRMVYPEDRAELTRLVQRAREEKIGYELEHRVVRPDGEVRSVRSVAEVELGEAGEVVCLFGLLQDLTRDLEAEHRKGELLRARSAQVEARVAEQRVREVLEAIPQQVWVTEADGRVLMVNGRVRAYFGTTEPPSERATLESPGVRALIHPDDHARAEAAWREARQSRSTFSVELRLRSTATGEYRWHLCRAEPQLDGEPRLARWIGTNTDLHAVREAQAEQARAERVARQERRRLRTIFERAPAAICITRGPEHHLMAANAAFRALAAGGPAVGRPLALAFPALSSQGVTALLSQVYESGRPHVDREIRLCPRGDATDAYFNLVLQPLSDAHGETEGVLLHAVDVTDMVYARLAVEEKARELEELTRHLATANEELDRFAYVTSHDLRAPLRGISNLAHWIEEDLRGSASAETREHLDLLRGRVGHMEMLIDGVLRYARAGRVAAELERVDLRRLIEDLWDLLDPPSDARVQIAGAMPVLVTERVPLAQVLQNLLDNALTHGRGEEGVQIHVGVERVEGTWSISVRDEGPGIDPRYHERIWEIFQTLNVDGRDGTGIGLSLVRKIVEGRGGVATLESLPGAGATFRFTWPEQPARVRVQGGGPVRLPGSRSGRATPVRGVAPSRRGPEK